MSKIYRICKECGDKKEVKNQKDAEIVLCRNCYIETKKKERTRICIDCGDVKICNTVRDAKAKRCKLCSAKKIAKNRIGTTTSVPKKRYWYFCSKCPSIKKKVAKQGSCLCTRCNSRRKRKYIEPIYFDMETMMYKVPKIRYFAICSDCPEGKESREVSCSESAGFKKCSKHRKSKKTKKDAIAANKKKTKVRKSSYAKTVSPEAIARVREENRLYRESVRAQEEQKMEVINQTKTDEEMIADFLANPNKKITVIESTIQDDSWSGTMKTKTSQGGILC